GRTGATSLQQTRSVWVSPRDKNARDLAVATFATFFRRIRFRYQFRTGVLVNFASCDRSSKLFDGLADIDDLTVIVDGGQHGLHLLRQRFALPLFFGTVAAVTGV